MFDLIYVLTGGGPGTSTEPVALYTFNALLQNLRFGYGSALSVVVFAMTFGLALLYMRGLGVGAHGDDGVTSARWWPTRWRVALLMLVHARFPFYWAIVASLTPEARLFQAPSLVPDARSSSITTARCSTSATSGSPIRNSLDRRRHDDSVLRDCRRALRVRAGAARVPGQGAAARRSSWP